MMANAAPWRWRDTMGPKQRPHRMQTLGGFNPSRRPGLFLQLRDGRAHVTFDQSATPLVLPRAFRERDVDYDLIRLGLRGQQGRPDPARARSRPRRPLTRAAQPDGQPVNM